MSELRSISQDDYKDLPAPDENSQGIDFYGVLGLGIFVVLITAAFVVGQVVGNRDARLLKTVDDAREAMAARSCGKHATLWKSPTTGAYGCQYSGAPDQTLMAPVDDPRTLSALR